MVTPIVRSLWLISVLLLCAIAIAADNTKGNEPVKPEWKYDAAQLQPFWTTDTMYGESVLFVQQTDGGPFAASLIFPSTKIISIKNSAGDITYTDGKDYTWKPGSREITILAGSTIPKRTWQELRVQPGSRYFNMAHRDGKGEIFWSEAGDYAKMQVVVTYKHKKGEWSGPQPTLAKTALPRTLKKLASKQPVTIVLLGDSISTGANCSASLNVPPYQPGYQDLLLLDLKKHYRGEITLKNLAVGGTDTPWGVAQVGAIVANKPDLVILAFGMNDSCGRPTAEYKANTKAMIDGIRKECPDAEIILVATMMGNPNWTTMHTELWPEYRDALNDLCGPGIAMANMTDVYAEMLKHKQYWDITGNGVNHPNDFCHRLYAQALGAMLVK